MTRVDSARSSRPVSRRRLLQSFAALSAGLALSAACGQQSPAPAKPTEGLSQSPTSSAAKPAAPAPAATSAPAAAQTPAASGQATTAPAAAKPAASGEAPKQGGTIRVGLYVEAVTMDPHVSGSKIDHQIYNNIYEKLVDLDNKLQ